MLAFDLDERRSEPERRQVMPLLGREMYACDSLGNCAMLRILLAG